MIIRPGVRSLLAATLLGGLVIPIVIGSSQFLYSGPEAGAASPTVIGNFSDDLEQVTATAGCTSPDPSTGLDVSLTSKCRQNGEDVPYTRATGVWYTASVATPPQSTVTSSGLTFSKSSASGQLTAAAVMLDAPVVSGTTGSYTVQTTVSPPRTSWASLVLSRDRHSSGYVTASDADLGLTINSAGDIDLYSAYDSSPATAFFSTTVPSTSRYTVSVTIPSSISDDVVLTVNGHSHTVPHPTTTKWHSWPNTAYLFLGAYLTTTTYSAHFTNLKVSSIDTYTATSATNFLDTFSLPSNEDSGSFTGPGQDYGLNDGLSERQPGVPTTTYSRVSGIWNSSTPPQPWFSQVDNGSYPDSLLFSSGPSAVKVDQPVAANGANDDTYTVQAIVTPDTTTAGDWSSLMISTSSSSSGWVAASTVDAGFTIRNTGKITPYDEGTALASWNTTRATSYSVSLTFYPSSHEVEAVVNGHTHLFTMTNIPVTGYVYMGAYISKATGTPAQLAQLRLSPLSGAQYYGYYGAVGDTPTHINHLTDAGTDIASYTNFNWVNGGGPTSIQVGGSGITLRALDECLPETCVVYVDTEFTCSTKSRRDPSCPIGDVVITNNSLSDLKSAIGSNLDNVSTIYMTTEPFGNWPNLSYATLESAARDIRSTFPGKLIMVNYTVTSTHFTTKPAVGTTGTTFVPSSVNLVSFDHYCATTETRSLRGYAATLLTRMHHDSAYYFQRIMFLPEATRYKTGLGIPTCKTLSDTQIATNQNNYTAMFTYYSNVAGLLNYGWWLGGLGDPTPDAAGHVPKTVAVEQAIGHSILNN
jgi:hypothetical protein